jgi:hypothetical protein
MPLLNVRLNGLDSLSLQVKYLRTAAQTGLRLGTDEAAGIMQTAEKLAVPVVSGRLRDSIAIAIVVDSPEKQVRAIAPDTPYARRVNNGFIGTDSLGRVYHQAGRHYVETSFESGKRPAEAAIKDGVYGSLDEAMNLSSQKARR